MNFEIYLEKLNEFARKNPEVLKLEVVYSHDDEGNEFQVVYFGPTPGYFDNNGYNRGDFKSETEFEEDEYINSICIN